MSDLSPPLRKHLPIYLWVCLVLIGITWGSTQLFSKLVVNAGHHPVGIAFAATLLGAVVLGVAMVVRGIRLPLSRRHLIFYAVCGLTGTALPNTVSYAAMAHLPVGVMSIVLATVPMMTFLAAVLFGLERPELRRALGLGCGTIAVLLLVIPEASLPGEGDAVWVALALITGLSYTAENIYIAKAQPEDCSPFQTLCGLFWAALLLLTPITLAGGTWYEVSGVGLVELWLVAMTVMHIFAYGGFVWLIAQAGPVFAAQVAYVVTLSGVFLGMVALGETHSAWVWLSLVLMLAGLALVQPRGRDV